MTKKNYEKIAGVLNWYYLYLLTVSYPPPLQSFGVLVDNFIEMLADDYVGDYAFNKEKFKEAVYKK